MKEKTDVQEIKQGPIFELEGYGDKGKIRSSIFV